jgi:hypothetical protein
LVPQARFEGDVVTVQVQFRLVTGKCELHEIALIDAQGLLPATTSRSWMTSSNRRVAFRPATSVVRASRNGSIDCG